MKIKPQHDPLRREAREKVRAYREAKQAEEAFYNDIRAALATLAVTLGSGLFTWAVGRTWGWW